MSLYFFRSNTTTEELGDIAKIANPEEITIDDDFSSDEEETVEGTCIKLLHDWSGMSIILHV